VPTLARFKPDGSFTTADQIEELAREHADRIFVRFEGRELSYADFNAAANRVAHWARDQGFGRGQAVALLMENRPEFLTTWAGLAKVGATAALINTNLTGAGLAHALRAADAQALVLGSERVESYGTAAGEISGLPVWLFRDPGRDGPSAQAAGAEDLDAALAGAAETNPDPSIRSELRTGDPLFYIYTSGTTGLPKAARFSHLRFLGIGASATWATDLHPGDVHYCTLPLYHSAGGAMVVSAVLGSGATLALRRRFSASRFWDEIRESEATHFQYIGEFCRYLMDQPARPDDRSHTVRTIIGNGLRPDIWEPFQKRFGIDNIVEFYGATEGNTVMINLENRMGSVGRFPFRFMTNARLVRFDVESETHLRDDKGFCIECAPGEPGELIGRIPKKPATAIGRFEGYTSREDSERKILRDVFKKGDAWFRSGDLLQNDEEGFFYFVDRIGDTFRWKGENVSTQEVAGALESFPGVSMVNVYGVGMAGGDGRAGMAAFLPENRQTFDGKAFYEFVGEVLPTYAAPLFVRLIEEPDMTGTFKLRKVDLQKEGFDLERVRDPLLFRDAEASAYVPLTPQILDEIRAGSRRL
jgi:fatty-acyl-CoA synthase